MGRKGNCTYPRHQRQYFRHNRFFHKPVSISLSAKAFVVNAAGVTLPGAGEKAFPASLRAAFPRYRCWWRRHGCGRGEIGRRSRLKICFSLRVRVRVPSSAPIHAPSANGGGSRRVELFQRFLAQTARENINRASDSRRPLRIAERRRRDDGKDRELLRQNHAVEPVHPLVQPQVDQVGDFGGRRAAMARVVCVAPFDIFLERHGDEIFGPFGKKFGQKPGGGIGLAQADRSPGQIRQFCRRRAFFDHHGIGIEKDRGPRRDFCRELILGDRKRPSGAVSRPPP